MLTVSAFGGFCGSAASLNNGVARTLGAWNDPDMLDVGDGGMTNAEYGTRLSPWAERAAPLIAGTDVRHMNAATRSVLPNREMIDADQDRLGAQGHPVLRDGGTKRSHVPLHGRARHLGSANTWSPAAQSNPVSPASALVTHICQLVSQHNP